jgi:hypothetical protein
MVILPFSHIQGPKETGTHASRLLFRIPWMGLSAKPFQAFHVDDGVITAFVFKSQDLNAGKARIERSPVVRGTDYLTTSATAAVFGNDLDGSGIAHFVLLTCDFIVFFTNKKIPKLTSSAWGFTFSPSSYQGVGRSSD